VRLWKFAARRKGSVSPRFAKPLGRWLQVWRQCVKTRFDKNLRQQGKTCEAVRAGKIFKNHMICNRKIYFEGLFFILLLFSNCQNKWQTVNYNGVSVQIPSDWGSKTTINLFNLNYEYSNITEYMISCWSKDNTNNTLAIQWIEYEIDDDLRIESDIELKQERFPMFKQLQFDEIVDFEFLGFRAKKCHFHGYFMEDYEGEYIAFTQNEISYLVLIGGD
jgi:hypothetical protein